MIEAFKRLFKKKESQRPEPKPEFTEIKKVGRRFVVPEEYVVGLLQLMDDYNASGTLVNKHRSAMYCAAIFPEVSEKGTRWEVDVTDALRPEIREVL